MTRPAALLLCTLLAGCAGSSPPVQLYHLRAAPPVAVPQAPRSAVNWQLVLPVRVPEYLDREALLLPQGRSGLLALSGHRWAESLRDSVPRVLRQDLTALLGEGRVWVAPLPPGIEAARQLRVEILAFEATALRDAVQLQARWTISEGRTQESSRAAAATLTVPSTGSDPDSLVAAHRLALWQLAERIASTP